MLLQMPRQVTPQLRQLLLTLTPTLTRTLTQVALQLWQRRFAGLRDQLLCAWGDVAR